MHSVSSRIWTRVTVSISYDDNNYTTGTSSYYYRASLRLWQFLSGDHKLEVFAPSSLCVWNQTPWRNLQTRGSPRYFWYELHQWFAESFESVMWINFSENRSDFPKKFHNFWFDEIEKQSILKPSRYGSKTNASVVLNDSEVTFLREEEDAVLCTSLCCVLVIYNVAKSKL